MIITDPITWLLERVETSQPFFNMRWNDGEQLHVFDVQPEGYMMSDATHVYREMGTMLSGVLLKMSLADPTNLLLGCGWFSEPDDLCLRFANLLNWLRMRERFNWCHPHYFLEAINDGGMIRLIDALRAKDKTVLVTNDLLADAAHCLDAVVVQAPRSDSWLDKKRIYQECKWWATEGSTFVWCAGAGVKPTAWRLFQEFPQSSHLDWGHLFDGVFGIKERSWLINGDGPWYAKYFAEFAPYVRRFIPV